MDLNDPKRKKLHQAAAEDSMRADFWRQGWTDEKIASFMEDDGKGGEEPVDDGPERIWDGRAERRILRQLLLLRRPRNSDMLEILDQLTAQVMGRYALDHLRTIRGIDLVPAVSSEAARMLGAVYDILMDPELADDAKVIEALEVYDRFPMDDFDLH